MPSESIDESERMQPPTGQSRGNADPFEAALAGAIEAAAGAVARGEPGALETLSACVSELKARREARADAPATEPEPFQQ